MAPPGLGERRETRGQIVGPVDAQHLLVAVRAQAGDQGIAVDAVDGRFARRIDGRHDGGVGAVQAGAELVEQIAQPRVAVRLDDGDDGARIGLTRRLQHRGDFDRVMAVIVDDGGAVPFADAGEAPLHAAETRSCRVRMAASGTPSSRATAMAASAFWTLCSPGMGSDKIRERGFRARAPVAEHGVEMRRAFGKADIGGAHIGLRAEAVGDDAPVA